MHFAFLVSLTGHFGPRTHILGPKCLGSEVSGSPRFLGMCTPYSMDSCFSLKDWLYTQLTAYIAVATKDGRAAWTPQTRRLSTELQSTRYVIESSAARQCTNPTTLDRHLYDHHPQSPTCHAVTVKNYIEIPHTFGIASGTLGVFVTSYCDVINDYSL